MWAQSAFPLQSQLAHTRIIVSTTCLTFRLARKPKTISVQCLWSLCKLRQVVRLRVDVAGKCSTASLALFQAQKRLFQGFILEHLLGQNCFYAKSIAQNCFLITKRVFGPSGAKKLLTQKSVLKEHPRTVVFQLGTVPEKKRFRTWQLFRHFLKPNHES